MPSLMATIGLNASPFQRELLKAQRMARQTGREIGQVLGELTFGKLGQFATAAGIEEALRKTAEYASEIRKLSIRTGESTDKIQEWAYAAMKAEVPLEDLVTAFEKLQITQAKAAGGDMKAFETLTRLGLNQDQISNLREAGNNFETIGARIKNATINGQMLKDITEAFGKSARQIIPVFKNDLREAAEEARNIGSVMDAKSIAEAAEASERLKQAWFSLRPLIADVIGWASKRIMDMADFFKLTIGVMLVDLEARRGAGKRADTFWGRTKENWAGQKDRELDIDKVAAKARNEYIEKVMKEREARERSLRKMEDTLRGKSENPLAAYAEVDESAGADKKSKAERLEERLAELKEKNHLATLTHEKQLAELTERRVRQEELIAKFRGQMTKENLLQAEIDAEEMRRQEQEAQKAVDRDMAKEAKEERRENHFRAPDVSSLQRIGAFVSPELTEAGNVAKRSEHHLIAIKDHLAKIERGQSRTKY